MRRMLSMVLVGAMLMVLLGRCQTSQANRQGTGGQRHCEEDPDQRGNVA
jgi:hypothetical protein